MRKKSFIGKILEWLGYTVHKIPSTGLAYDQDGLYCIHNHDFMTDPSFRKAYERGIAATKTDYHWHWRVHVGLWAAHSVSKLEGDFVECGVNRGFLSSAIMEYLNWNSLDKAYYLMDTFHGLDNRFVSQEERERGKLEYNDEHLESGFYTTDLDSVRENFSRWQNVRIIAGSIPDTLDTVKTEKVAFLHLDMNCSLPEMAALNYFWGRLVPGAFVLFDDYAYKGYEPLKAGADSVAAAKGVNILSLPTGQGLLIKPGREAPDYEP